MEVIKELRDHKLSDMNQRDLEALKSSEWAKAMVSLRPQSISDK
jgi:hypothetical protein